MKTLHYIIHWPSLQTKYREEDQLYAVWVKIISIGILYWRPHEQLVGDPQIFVGDPHIFVGDPHIFVGDPLIFVGDPHIFVGDPHIFIRHPHIFVGIPHIFVGDLQFLLDSPFITLETPCSRC